jgi:hypothetical protein
MAAIDGMMGLARTIIELRGMLHATERARLTALRAEPPKVLLGEQVLVMGSTR